MGCKSSKLRFYTLAAWRRQIHLSKGRQRRVSRALRPASPESGTTRQTRSCEFREFTIHGTMLEDGRRFRCGWQMLRQRAEVAARRVSMQTSTAKDEGQSHRARSTLSPRAMWQLIGNGSLSQEIRSRVNGSRPVTSGRTGGVWHSVVQTTTEPQDVHVSEGTNS